MARLGRSWPIPVTIRGRLPYHRAEVGLGVFESISEWPPPTVVTPNANLFLGPFESLSEWPELAFQRGQRFTLPAWESLSEWPAPTISIPIKPGDSLTGAHGEVEWNGTLWGPATSVRVLEPVDGWLGTPSIDNLNVERPGRHGAWDARKLAKQRIVTIKLQPDSGADPTQVHTLLDAIIAATGIPESEDPLPLVVKGYGAPLLAYGQVIDRPIVMDSNYNMGLPTVGVLIACADPRLYGLDQRGATVPLNAATVLANVGNIATSPTVRLEGPAVGPMLTNTTLGRVLQFDLTLDADELLEIDTDNGTVTVGDTNMMSALTGTSVPVQDFVLAAGSNSITYTAADGGGNGADFLWRDAWL